MRDQGGFRLDPKAPNLLSSHDRDFGELLGCWIDVHVRIDQKDLTAGQDQRIHRRIDATTLLPADHLIDKVQVAVRRAHHAADHALTRQVLRNQSNQECHLTSGIHFSIFCHDRN